MHLRRDVIPTRDGTTKKSIGHTKRIIADAYDEKGITYAVLVASETMSSMMALVCELLAALQFKPIYWNPESKGIGEFQYRIYVNCEDPRDVFDKKF